jgi:two-component system sensor histidine kinase BarA
MRCWQALLFCIMALGIVSTVNAQHSESLVQLISKNHEVNLSSSISVMYESETELSVMQAKEMLSQFVWHSGGNPNYGFSEQGVWLYTTLSNVTTTDKWVISVAFSQLDNVDMYLLEDGQIIASSFQGKLGIPSHYRLPVMKAELPYAQTVELFIRLQNKHGSLVAPISIQSSSSHEMQNFYDNLLWGLFYGGLIILAIYNLVVYLTLREPSLLAYVGYICTVLVWQFVWGGHANMMLPRGFSYWFNIHTDIIFVLIGIGSGVFTLVFLEAKHTAPKTLPFIKASIGLLAIMGLCSMVNLFSPVWQNVAVYVVSMLAISCYTYAGFESYSNQFYAARYFIFAWSILATCALIGMFSLINVLPSNFFTTYCFQFGVFFEAGLFSLALMDKSRHQLQLEVHQATNDLRNNIELVEEQNVRLDIARKEAVAASNVKSQFLANMSHEIRTPLNAILGFSKELQQGDFSADKRDQINIINAAADNLMTIVNDVLDVSKIEAGKLRINSHPFSINELLEEMTGVMAKSAHLKGLEFVYDIEPLPLKLIGDSYRIRQILNNLLGNALKFTDTGHIGLSASGKLLEHGIFELNIKIEDTGIGISREDKRKLFTAFSQVDDALNRSYQGTGLGLVICKELVKLMHGQLSLQSSPGQGSIFNVTVRMNILNVKPSISADSDWQNQTVLIFEPYPNARLTASKLLRSLGANVTSADSIAFLQTCTQTFDYLIYCIHPQHSVANEKAFACADQIKAEHKILLCSGEDSCCKFTKFSEQFSPQLRLPLTAGKLKELMHKPVKEPINELQKRLEELPPVTVLAVDDMEMNLRLLSTWLKPSRLELKLAFSGQSAVAMCEETEFDLILMDVQMPNMDGLQATKLIRKTKRNFGTPIIAVTAHAFKEEQQRLLNSGMDDYLPKPLDLSDLVDLINRWCHQGEDDEPQTKIFDWSLALKRANQNADAARDLFAQFVEQLPEFERKFTRFQQQQNHDELQPIVHALHGICCYTGAVALHASCSELEGQLKRQQFSHVPILLAKLIRDLQALRLQENDIKLAMRD